MDSPPISTLAVIGAGTMGAGIAQVALEAGWQVRLHDANPAGLDTGRRRIRDGLAKRAARRGLEAGAADDWVASRLGELHASSTVERAAERADLVIEAIVEDLAAKQALVEAVDSACPPGTILATNTSALSITAIATAAARHPERVLGLHFFNPAPVLRLVEVVPGAATDSEVEARATSIVTGWGKTPVRSTDTPGFIVNRVNRPFTIEALRLVEAGAATVPQVDAAIRADGFSMGPFELMDLVGIDVNLAAATGVWEGLGRPERLRPSPIQGWLVGHGRLGRKSGTGFYRYRDGHEPVLEPLPASVAPHATRGSVPAHEVASRIRRAIAAEAVLAREAGVATESDIDTALWLGAAHPEGPFAWLRRIGPDAAGGAGDPTIDR
ncbi:MAG: 3-hydroxybutyryl-CoA dehydrogenase [Chloroflexi bacterium]|nr:3-hydroxybutyryl-CoA dehydrogenase [Chloroflexota bacterium]